MPHCTSPFRRAAAAAIALAVCSFFPSPALADTGNFYLPYGGGDYRIRTTSFAAKRFDNVVRQKYDFSCGSAALATLLTYSYDLPVDEMTVLSTMYDRGDKAKIHKEGFSLLDMKNYLAGIGIKAEGYREKLDKLTRVGVPAIVLINHNGYMHFVVVQGVTRTKVLVADPTLGLHIVNRHEFEKMWNGILFVVLDMKPLARRYFNTKTVWAKRRQHIETTEIGAGAEIAPFTTMLNPNPNYY